jgi:hypothetical protein
MCAVARSSGGWVLKTEGVQSHSSGIFTEDVGAGAIFEMSRILTAFVFGRISHLILPLLVVHL